MTRSVTCPRCGHAFPLADPGAEPREEECRKCVGSGEAWSDGAFRQCVDCGGTGMRLVHNSATAPQDDRQPPPTLLRAATAVCEALYSDPLACRLGPLNTALLELDHVINPRPRLEPSRGAWNPEEDELSQRLTPPPTESATLIAWHPGSREVPVIMGRAREAPDA